MKYFTLFKKIKSNDRCWGKGVIRIWKHNLSGELLEEHCYPTHHVWMKNRGTATLKYWIDDFTNNYNSYKKLQEKR